MAREEEMDLSLMVPERESGSDVSGRWRFARREVKNAV